MQVATCKANANARAPVSAMLFFSSDSSRRLPFACNNTVVQKAFKHTCNIDASA